MRKSNSILLSLVIASFLFTTTANAGILISDRSAAPGILISDRTAKETKTCKETEKGLFTDIISGLASILGIPSDKNKECADADASRTGILISD